MKFAYALAVASIVTVSTHSLADEVAAGRKVFTEQAQPSCTICHTLSDAGSAGAIGPNLDELKPDRQRVINAVTGGVGVMPAFGESLSEEQIQAVAAYVSTVTGAAK